MLIEILRSDPNVVVLDGENILSLEAINSEIHKELIKRKDVVPNDKRTKRAVKKDRYIIIHQHGSFSTNEIIDFLIRNLKEDRVEYSIRNISVDESEFLKDMLPVFCFLNNQYRGGPSSISDSNTIDVEIKNLCCAFNNVPGIKTFASCGGHGGARSMYICYTAKNILAAEIMSYYLTRIVEKYFRKLNVDSNLVSAEHEVSYMPDGIPTSIYFTFKILYYKSESESVYKFANFAAEEIEQQVKRKNFGTIGEDEYYHFDKIE
jgi:hypothetical protein